MSTVQNVNKIVKDGLLMYLDVANTKSYPGTGTNVTDLSQYKSDSLLSNGPTFSTDNLGGIVLDGIDDSIVCANSSIFPLLTSFSLSTFVKLNRNTGTQMMVGRSGGAGAFYAHNYYWAVINGYLYLSFRDGTGNYPNATSNVLLSTGTVYQLGLTYSPATSLSFYINGVQRNTFSSISITNQTPTSNAATFVAVGANYAEGKDYTQGTIYNAQIYNRVLSSTEILQNYNALKSRFGL